jgi:hypothetical protein
MVVPRIHYFQGILPFWSMVVVEAWNSKGMPPRVNFKMRSLRYTLKSIDYTEKCLYYLWKRLPHVLLIYKVPENRTMEYNMCGHWQLKALEDYLTTHWLQDLCSFHFRERSSEWRYPELPAEVDFRRLSGPTEVCTHHVWTLMLYCWN